MRMPGFSFWVTGVVGTGLGGLGVVTDCLSILILLRIKSLFAFILVGLSTFDLFFISTSFLAYSLPALVEQDGKSNQISSKFLMWMEILNDYALVGSIYCTIALAFERVLALYDPFKVKSKWSSPLKPAIITLITVNLISLTVQLLKFIDYTPIPDETVEECGIDSVEYSEGYTGVNFQYVEYYVQWPFFILIIALPFGLLTVLNLLVWSKMKEIRKNRQILTNTGSSSTAMSGSLVKSTPKIGNSGTVVAIIIVFLFCQLGCIMFIVCRHFFVCVFLEWGNVLFSLEMFLLNINSSTNFVIYYLSAANFRTEFKKLFPFLTRK